MITFKLVRKIGKMLRGGAGKKVQIFRPAEKRRKCSSGAFRAPDLLAVGEGMTRPFAYAPSHAAPFATLY